MNITVITETHGHVPVGNAFVQCLNCGSEFLVLPDGDAYELSQYITTDGYVPERCPNRQVS